MDLSKTLTEIDDCSYLEKKLGKEMEEILLNPKTPVYIIFPKDNNSESTKGLNEHKKTMEKLIVDRRNFGDLSAPSTYWHGPQLDSSIVYSNLENMSVDITAYPAKFKKKDEKTYEFLGWLNLSFDKEAGYIKDLKFGNNLHKLLDTFLASSSNNIFVENTVKCNIDNICNLGGFIYEPSPGAKYLEIAQLTKKEMNSLKSDEYIIYLPIIKYKLKITASLDISAITNPVRHNRDYLGEYLERNQQKDYEFLVYRFPVLSSQPHPVGIYLTKFSESVFDKFSDKIKKISGKKGLLGGAVKWKTPDGIIKVDEAEFPYPGLNVKEIDKESYKKRLAEVG